MEFTALDILITFLCACSVPAVVNHYLRKPLFSSRLRQNVLFGGLMWLAFSWINEGYVYELLGIYSADSRVHWTSAVQAAELLSNGTWPFSSMIPVSNQGWRAYLMFFQLLGGGYQGATTLNAYAAFLGGLTLARAFARLFPPQGSRGEKWWLLVIFFPSTVFWTTCNLKEAFVYWGICQGVSVLPALQMTGVRVLTLPVLAGIGVMTFLRPHVAMIWLAAMAPTVLLQRRNRATIFTLVLISLPVTSLTLQSMLGQQASSGKAVFEQLAQQSANLSDPRQGSYIDYGPEGATFFVSGFTCVFFRPFPWQLRTFGVALSICETWGITLLIIRGWTVVGAYRRRLLLKSALVQTAIFAILLFSVLFTYMPNEGLIVRERVQVVPALLTLALVPYLLKRSYRIPVAPGEYPRVGPGRPGRGVT